MGIDPEVEKPTRKMLDHVVHGELEQAGRAFEAVGDQERQLECIALCVSVAGYIAIDVCGNQWPTDASLRTIAKDTAETAKGTTTGRPLGLTEAEIYKYLARSALGFEPLDQVFPPVGEALTLPILITARLLLTFRPSDKHWWEYLDVIEDAIEKAATIDLSVLPAMMLRSRRPGTKGQRAVS